MMLETVSARIFVRIAAKIRQYKQRRFARIFRLALNRLPNLRTQTVRTANAVHIKRIRPRVRDINVVQRDPQQTRRHLPHQLPRDINRKLIRAGKRQRVILKFAHGKLQKLRQLLHLKIVSAQLWRIQRRLVVVAQQMFVVFFTRSRCRQQMLRQNHPRAQSGPVQTVATLSDSVKSVARRNHPGVRSRPLQVLPEVFKNGGRLRRRGCEIVERLVDSSG